MGLFEKDDVEVCFWDERVQQEPIAETTLPALVEGWFLTQELDGVLHPYLDDTLVMLARLTEAQQWIIGKFEADDPHAEALGTLLAATHDYLARLVKVLDDDEDDDAADR